MSLLGNGLLRTEGCARPVAPRALRYAVECSSAPLGARLGGRDAGAPSTAPRRPVPRALPEVRLQPLPEPTAPPTSAPQPSTASSAGGLVVTTFRWPSQLPGTSVGVTGDFTGWGAPLPLTRSPGGDWVRSIALPPGPIQFKFVIDGEFTCSPCELAAASASDSGAVNNHRLVQPTCEFVWPSGALGGRDVMVAGDWSGWGELLPLTHDPVAGTHSLACCLPPGDYTYQFLVDGEWRLRPDADAVHTPDGHFANAVSVAMPPAFRVFYSTGWNEAALMVRGLDAEGLPLGEWTRVPLHDTASRGHLATGGRRWKVAKVAASGLDAPVALEFYPVGRSSGREASQGEDRPHGGGTYLCPRPGGYKLASGRLRPFARAAAPRMCLVSDLDGTLVGDDGDVAADARTADFCRYYEDNAALVDSVLVYNTGRSLGAFQGLLEAKAGALPVPDALITAVGTKIFLLDREGGTRGSASGLKWVEDSQWGRLLDGGWDLEGARAAGAEGIAAAPADTAHWLDDGSEHPHRIALSVRADTVPAVRKAVEATMSARGLRCQIIISGHGDWRYVDVVSAQGGKLAALEYIRALFGVAKERCVAAGDSGNDALMLGGGNPAVVVGNAQEELLEWVMRQPQDGRLVVADAPQAHGVIEGLARLGLY